MAGVAHTPYLEKRPSGLFFRRRIPSRLTEIPDPIHGSFLCLSVRTDLLRDARAIVRGLTALTDLAFALMTERRDMRHLAAENIRLLEALARFQVEAHDGARAMAEPRTLEAAHYAAECERATQDVLRSAIARGDRAIAREPLRAIGGILGVALPDEDTESGRALAFEALRVLLDVSHARERAEIGQFQEATPIFRSAMARRSNIVRPMPDLASTVDVSMAPIALPVSTASVTQPANSAITVSSRIGAATNAGQVPAARVTETVGSPADAHVSKLKAERPDVAKREDGNPSASSTENDHDEETRFRIKMRPPRLKNIDIRALSPESQRVLEKQRGICVLEAIDLYAELKLLGYENEFSKPQSPVAAQGEKYRGHSMSKVNVCRAFWPEFVGTGPFEQVDENDIRDALAFLPNLPHKHGKGIQKFVATHGYKGLIERIDSQTENDFHRNLAAARANGRTSQADIEAARLDAKVDRLRTETIVKHRRMIAAVGRMLVELQLIDKNPFEICSVSNFEKKALASNEDGRKRTVWDDRFKVLLSSTAYQAETREPDEPMFWLPLIARLMGLREEEACQLGPDDFGSVDGIAYVDIKRVNENHVKTAESERRIPVHPQLIELGLLHLVEMRRRSGHKRGNPPRFNGARP